MNIYRQNNRWKTVLLVMGFAILLITLLYSNFLAERLKENEMKNIYIFKEALIELQKVNDVVLIDDNNPLFHFDDLNKDVSLLDTIMNSFPLPVIFEDENGFLEGQNFPADKNNNLKFLQEKRADFLASGQSPIMGTGYATNIYYFNSALTQYIKLFPIIQALLVGSFIAFGYFLFNASRKAEQNQVWAGMAKETAHQLGTPISAILGWLEYFKDEFKDHPDRMDVVMELEKDVDRLELVADRFSKIGSKPVLESVNLYDEIVDVKNYIQRRSPKKIIFDIVKPDDTYFAMINKHLFDWVIENLMRNSLDAMDGKGKIKAEFYENEGFVCIEISDTGHGISSNKFKSVFRPGYSTKKRGWGLGLSLAKRIIEEYHKGRIFVKNSKPYECTTFCIKLQKVNSPNV